MNFKSNKAKDLLYQINGGDRMSYDSLMEEIASNTTLLMNAETITWCPPLGFISKTEKGVVDAYFTVDEHVFLDNQFVCESSADGSVLDIEDLINNEHVHANYHEGAHKALVEIHFTKKENTVEMASVSETVLMMHPLFDAPFMLRKGSHVPAEFVKAATHVQEAHHKNLDSIKQFTIDSQTPQS